MKYAPFAFFLALLNITSVFAAPLWNVDTDKSHLQFIGKDSGKDFSGEFKKFTPEIVFDAQNLTDSSIKVTVDTSSAVTENQTYDGSLPSSEWFNVKNFPNAIFQSTSIHSLGTDKSGLENYEAIGTLTMLGVSKDLNLPFSLEITGDTAHATGSLILKRLDFGLGKTVDAKGDTVSNDITVKFDITAHQ